MNSKFYSFFGASLSEPHIDRDNVPRREECLYISMYVAACSICRLNYSREHAYSRSARAYRQRPLLHKILNMLDLTHVDKVFYCHQETTQEAWAALSTKI